MTEHLSKDFRDMKGPMESLTQCFRRGDGKCKVPSEDLAELSGRTPRRKQAGQSAKGISALLEESGMPCATVISLVLY